LNESISEKLKSVTNKDPKVVTIMVSPMNVETLQKFLLTDENVSRSRVILVSDNMLKFASYFRIPISEQITIIKNEDKFKIYKGKWVLNFRLVPPEGLGNQNNCSSSLTGWDSYVARLFRGG
jgi:hypothetical protein